MITIDGVNYLNLEEQVQQNKEDIAELQQREVEAPVTSVNEKTGDVVLDATDIKLTTTGTDIQANIIRLDEAHDDNYNYISAVADDVVDLQGDVSALDTRVDNVEDDVEDLTNNKQNKLTAGTNITIVNDVISASGGGATMFVAVYGTTPYATVKQHIDAGDVVVVQYADFSNTNYATYYGKNSSNKYTFCYVSGYMAMDQITVDSSNGWAKTSRQIILAENLSRNITSSSTDSQAPSAKALYTLHTTDITHGMNVNGVGTPVLCFIVNEGAHIPSNGLVFVVDGD